MATLKGIFTSIWDGGVNINTPATLETETGYIEAESVDVDGLECLEEETFTDENGKEYQVCPECHAYVMKPVMINGIGHNSDEEFVCSDENCDSNL